MRARSAVLGAGLGAAVGIPAAAAQAALGSLRPDAGAPPAPVGMAAARAAAAAAAPPRPDRKDAAARVAEQLEAGLKARRGEGGA